MRPLRNASLLTKVVATLGLLLALQEAIEIAFGSAIRFIPSFLPSGHFTVASQIKVGYDRLTLLVVGVVLSGLLWLVYSHSEFGWATTASAENRRALASLGVSPERVARINWALGSALAGLAGALIVPITGLNSAAMPLIVIPALAAAVVGRFESFPLTFVGALVVGVASAEVTRYVSQPGWSDAVPFLLVLGVVMVRGTAYRSRSTVRSILPRIGSGVVRPIPLLVLLVVSIASVYLWSTNWDAAVTATMVGSIVGLSLVVVTGYAGQISLAQYALAGVGAFIATRLSQAWNLPFLVALVIGVLGSIPIGILIGLPALRARGLSLAVVTLGLGLGIQEVVLSNPSYTGGAIEGTVVKTPHIGPLNLSSTSHPASYAVLAIALFTGAGLLVANLRRGRSGRRLVAVRTNERAATSLGISVVGAKLYAFGLATGLAALGGVLLAFENTNVVFDPYSPSASIVAVVFQAIGGLGYVAGAVLGGAGTAGAVAQETIQHFFKVGNYLDLVGGVLVVLTVLHNPDGAASRMTELWDRLRDRVFGPGPAEARRMDLRHDPVPIQQVTSSPMSDAVLTVDSLGVRYGGVIALDGASLSVRGGEVVGVIGPNGAGKTTLIDAITGFCSTDSGTVSLNGVPFDRLSARQRAVAGVTRSFQSLELFEDLTVRDNLRAACEPRDLAAYLTDLVWPGRSPLSRAALDAVDDFALSDLLDVEVRELPYGTRRLVAIARAVATEPKVLLLDEPAAGLDEQQSEELGGLIRRLADTRGMGVLVVEHHVPLILAVCDRVLVLNFGRTLTYGRPEQVQSDPAVRTAYLGAV